jgi:hypothetical protein
MNISLVGLAGKAAFSVQGVKLSGLLIELLIIQVTSHANSSSYYINGS